MSFLAIPVGSKHDQIYLHVNTVTLIVCVRVYLDMNKSLDK